MGGILINEQILSEMLSKNSISKVLIYIKKMYHDNPTLRDGYAMFGNIFITNKQYSRALTYFERDRIQERISPAYRQLLGLILKKLNRNKEAILEIHRAYLEDPSLSYGCHLVEFDSQNIEWIKDNKIRESILFFKKKGTTNQFHNDILLLIRNGQFNDASKFVEQNYKINSDLFDGYALIGSALKVHANFEDALFFYGKDNNLGRLSPNHRIIYAQLLAQKGMLLQAEIEVQRAYEDDLDLNDGYALIASVFRLRGEYDKSFKYLKKDSEVKRLSSVFRHIYAEQLSRLGLFNEAKAEVEIGYSMEPSLLNGFARIGNVLRAQHKFKEALIWYEYDQGNERLTPFHKCILAILLVHAGQKEDAFHVMEEAYSKDQTLRDGFVRLGNALRLKQKNVQVLEYYEKEAINGRFTPLSKCIYAELLLQKDSSVKLYNSKNDRETLTSNDTQISNVSKKDDCLKYAIQLVEEAYIDDDSLEDKYARLGSIKYKAKDWNSAFLLMDKDYTLNRMTSEWKKRFKQICDNIPINRFLIKRGGTNYIYKAHSYIENKIFTAKAKLSGKGKSDDWLKKSANKHFGERVFILATGPSLNHLDLGKLSGEKVIGVNGTYMLDTISLDYFVYVSGWWYKQHLEGIRSVRCKRRFIPENLRQELDSPIPTSWYKTICLKKWSKYFIPNKNPAGFSKKPFDYIYAGGTVIFVCLQLAYYLGFKEVVLIGLDHSYGKNDLKYYEHGGSHLVVEGYDRAHFSNKYVSSGTSIPLDFGAMEHGYKMAKAIFEEDGRRIINASAKTRLTTFPKVNYNELF